MARVGFEPTTPVFEWTKTVHALGRGHTKETGNRNATAIPVTFTQLRLITVIGKCSNSERYTPSSEPLFRLTMVYNT
jgi:hypothetical protein